MLRRIACMLVAILPALTLHAKVDYESEIKPLLLEKCAACHGVLRQESGLRLDAGSLVRQGADQGPVIDVDDPTASELIERVTTTDSSIRMPPHDEGAPLTQPQVGLLLQWIAEGASSPVDEEILDSPQSHWAYQKPARPPLPSSSQADATNPIDAFIAAKYHEHGVTPTPLATDDQLLRRLHLDVTGLPPTLMDQEHFADATGDAGDRWRRHIDQLLASDAYGERWARVWMDVWRYSDWEGYREELRGSQRHIWHWRDWIIESLNGDKGYDRMIEEMLAADEITPEDFSAVRATGFLVRNYHASNRDIWLDATVEHTAKAFLGMTIACARCHDHKYDPLAQQEYYAMRALFEPHHVRTERLPGEADLVKAGLPRAYDSEPSAPTYLYIRGNEKQPDKEHPIAAGVPKILSVPFDVQPIKLPPIAAHPHLREFIETEEINGAEQVLARAKQSLQTMLDSGATTAESLSRQVAEQTVASAEANLESLRARWRADKSLVQGDTALETRLAQASQAERKAGVEQAKLAVLNARQAVETATAALAAIEPNAADHAKKKTELEAAQKRLDEAEKNRVAADQKLDDPSHKHTPVAKSYPDTSTGRRMALAKWITHPDHPLTARVAVNHIWLRYFGEPLVENVFDFGLRSPEPEHRELLDWLACELVENGWSMKHLHRLILNSHVYRLSSSTALLDDVTRQRNRATDPDNRLFWRANVRRLDAEMVRDSMLFVGGELDRAHGGPDIDFREGESNARRSLYFRHAYEKQMTMLVVFDAPSPTDCYRRTESVIPQQALALANSPLSFQQSRRLAARLSGDAVSTTEFVALAYRATLGRSPTSEERELCEEFLASQTRRLEDAASLQPVGGAMATKVPPHSDSAQRARENLVHVLMNHNDFVSLR